MDHGLAADGQLQWSAVELTAVAEEARQRLDLSPLSAIAFGRCAAAAVMLMKLSAKLPLRLELDARGDGPLKRVLVEVGIEGDLRGLVAGHHARGVDGPADYRVGPALGKGTLRVGRTGVQGSSYDSHVELVSGEVAKDVAHYLAQSEQRRCAVLLGVLVRSGGVQAAGGLIVEALPEASARRVALVEQEIGRLRSISRLIGEGGVDGAIEEVLGSLDPQLAGSQEIRYRCRCDRPRLAARLATLDREDLVELTAADGTLDAQCSYCGEVYRMRLEELLPS